MAVAEQSIQKQSLVQICGETFDNTEAPSADSSYVQEKVVETASGIVVSKLSDDLRDMGRFIRIALYCAVVKGDPKLEENLREFIKWLATLCDDSAIAADRFEPTSPTFVIEILQAGYSNLLEGHEDMALDNFEDVLHEAEEMEVLSKDLQERFEDEGNTLRTTKHDWAIEVSEERQKVTILFLEAKAHLERAMRKKEMDDEIPSFLLDEVREEHKEDIRVIEQAIEEAHNNELTAKKYWHRDENLLAQLIREHRLLQLEKAYLQEMSKREETIREKMEQITFKQAAIDRQQVEVNQRRSDIKKFQWEREKQKRALEQLETELLTTAEKRKCDLIRRTIEEKRQQQEHSGTAIDVIEATEYSLMSIVGILFQVAGFWMLMATNAKHLQSERLQKRIKKAIDSVSTEKRLKL